MFVVGSLNIGGIQRVNAVLANYLGEEQEVFVFTAGSRDESAYPMNVPVIKSKKNENWNLIINLIRISGLLHLDFIKRCIFKKAAQRISDVIEKQQPDVLILNAENILYLPFIKKKHPNLKYVSWLHTNTNIYLDRVFKGANKDFIDGLTKSDTVVCLTEEDLRILKTYNSNTVVIYSPLTNNQTQVASLDTKIISWTGRIANPVKGLDYLAEVASQLPQDWKISVAGSGNDELFDKLIKKYGSENKIIRHGSLTGDKLKEHYLNSSIYLMTSRWEGFGLVLVEAMSFGLPIVAFKQSGSNEVLKAGKSGILIENGDVGAMVATLLELIDDKQKRETYQQKSLLRVKDFDKAKILSKWREIICMT